MTLYARLGDTLEATATLPETDLADAAAEFQVAATPGHDGALSWSEPPAITIDPSLGTVTVSIPASDTIEFDGHGRNWVWQLTLSWPDGRVMTVAAGQLIVDRRVTP